MDTEPGVDSVGIRGVETGGDVQGVDSSSLVNELLVKALSDSPCGTYQCHVFGSPIVHTVGAASTL